MPSILQDCSYRYLCHLRSPAGLTIFAHPHTYDAAFSGHHQSGSIVTRPPTIMVSPLSRRGGCRTLKHPADPLSRRGGCRTLKHPADPLSRRGGCRTLKHPADPLSRRGGCRTLKHPADPLSRRGGCRTLKHPADPLS